MSTDTETAVAPESNPRTIPFTFTPNIYLACFLATMKCKPHGRTHLPAKTAAGNPVVVYQFDNSDKVAGDIAKHWGNYTLDWAPGWQTWTAKERQMAIDLITAFTHNLRWFLNDVKRKGE